VPAAVRVALVAAHCPNGTEADRRICANRVHVLARRVDREAMMSPLPEEPFRGEPQRSGSQPLALVLRRQKMSRPAERWSGSVSSLYPSHPANAPSTSIENAAPSLTRPSRVYSASSSDPHHSLTPGRARMTASSSTSPSLKGRNVTRPARGLGSTTPVCHLPVSRRPGTCHVAGRRLDSPIPLALAV